MRDDDEYPPLEDEPLDRPAPEPEPELEQPRKESPPPPLARPPRAEPSAPPPNREEQPTFRRTATDPFLEQGLPSSVDIEKSVLGAVLLEQSLIYVLMSRVSDPRTLFFLNSHQILVEVMLELTEKQMPIELLTMCDVLRRRGDYERSGGAVYIASLIDGVPRTDDIGYLLEILVQKSELRSEITIFNDGVSLVFEGEMSARQIAEWTHTSLFEIVEGERSGPQLASLDVKLPELLEAIEQRAGRPEMITGTPTGLTDFDRLTAGLQRKSLTILAARPSQGKAQPLNTRVLTATGVWKQMGELALGEKLASVDSTESFVTGIFPQGIKPSFRLTLSDGRSTRCCNEHMWEVQHRSWRSRRIITTEALGKLLGSKRNKGRIWLPRFSGHCGAYSAESLPLEPWLLGVLLGDGTLGKSIKVSSADDSLLTRVQSSLEKYNCTLRYDRGYDWRIKSKAPRWRKGHKGVLPNEIKQRISACGLLGTHSDTKFLPAVYLEADYESRLELLRGLVDTDGYVQRSGPIQYTTASARLATEVQALARSLGAICSISEKKTSYTYRKKKRAGRLAYTLNIRSECKNNLAWLERKRVARASKVIPRLTVTSVVLESAELMQCISVSHPRGLYVTDEYIVTHNTAMALNWADYAADQQAIVAFFSLEMSTEQLIERQLAAASRVDAYRLRSGYLNREEWARIADGCRKMSSRRIFYNDSSSLSVIQASSLVRQLKHRVGCDLVIVDYLQLLEGREAGRREVNRQQEVTLISRQLKALAKDCDVPVVALSQLSRSPEHRRGNEPRLTDLRESGSLEQDGDLVCFIYRDEVYNPTDENRGTADLIIGKQRNGPIGRVQLAFLSEFGRFENLWRE